MITKKLLRKTMLILLFAFIGVNLIAFMHAYKFTHFDISAESKTKKPEELSVGQKIKTAILGINNPKPINKCTPNKEYETIVLKSNTSIECWEIMSDSAIGTVVLFHGFSGEKSSMLDKADVFLDMHYNVFLVDFMGSGGSEGTQKTIGFKEAKDVKVCVDYLTVSGKENIVLFGTSMGAAALMKALKDNELPVSSIIIECPYGTMLKTVKSRFKDMNFPSFPMAHLLMFWGGLQNGFNAYKHNPQEYAKHISCPTLLLYGELDIKVSREEIDAIFNNLNGIKQLKTFPLSGHENYLNKEKEMWKKYVSEFLKLNSGLKS